jgi:hypothetical protein
MRCLTENQRQKRKKAKRREYIARGGVLTGTEAQALININENSRVEAVQGGESSYGIDRIAASTYIYRCGWLWKIFVVIVLFHILHLIYRSVSAFDIWDGERIARAPWCRHTECYW